MKIKISIKTASGIFESVIIDASDELDPTIGKEVVKYATDWVWSVGDVLSVEEVI